MQNMDSGGHRRRGGARETWRRWVGPVRGRCTGAMASAGEWRFGNTSELASIIPPGVGTTGYWGVVHILMGGRTEGGAGINHGNIIDRG